MLGHTINTLRKRAQCSAFFQYCCFFRLYNLPMWMSLEACPKGYFGFGCETKCGFPYYGLKCALNCSCNVEHCDHIYGCNRRIIDTNIIDSPKTLTTLSHITIGNSKWKENYGHIINKDNSVNGQTLTTEKESKWMRPVIFGIFGVAGLLFFITLIYLFTHRQIQRPSVVGPT